MSPQPAPTSLQELVETVPNIVDHLYTNPAKSALTVFTTLMPADVVRLEYTSWADEQRSWRETVALHDQTYHMNNLYLRGPDAVAAIQSLAVNTFTNFTPGRAKQFLGCSPEGYVIGDGILYYLDDETLLLVGNAPTTNWVQFNCERSGYDVDVELDPLWALNRARQRTMYRYQVEGPNAWEVLERANGGPLPEIKFFRSDWLTIDGCNVRAMRHSMGGVPGLELSGPWEDRDRVKSALVAAGADQGLRRIGSLAYFTTVVETGWWAVPVSAVYTSPELTEYREWLPARGAEGNMSLGGSFYSSDIEDYYSTPWDLGYGHLVKFDHEFVGRDALERMVDQPHRRKVTLVWHPDDFLAAMQTLFEDGTPALQIDLPLAATARYHYDRVLDTQGRTIGVAHYPAYTVNERAMLSLGSVDEEYAEPGTEVVMLWGEDGGGSRSGPSMRPHRQVEIRATVAPVPISSAAREYRAAITSGR